MPAAAPTHKTERDGKERGAKRRRREGQEKKKRGAGKGRKQEAAKSKQGSGRRGTEEGKKEKGTVAGLRQAPATKTK